MASELISVESSIKAIFTQSIFNVEVEGFLDKISSNVSDIKEIFLLMIAYEMLLRELLSRYDSWKLFLDTISEIKELSLE